jgi:hypothetical protein
MVNMQSMTLKLLLERTIKTLESLQTFAQRVANVQSLNVAESAIDAGVAQCAGQLTDAVVENYRSLAMIENDVAELRKLVDARSKIDVRVIISNLRNLSHEEREEPGPLSQPLSAKVSFLFGLGSTSATALCVERGFDPDEVTPPPPHCESCTDLLRELFECRLIHRADAEEREQN